jgi:hypothetical protein
MSFITNHATILEFKGFNLLDNLWAIPYYPSINDELTGCYKKKGDDE